MKKIYQIPETMVQTIAPSMIIAISGHDEIGSGEELVKRDRSVDNSSNYNVWNDDWQKP